MLEFTLTLRYVCSDTICSIIGYIENICIEVIMFPPPPPAAIVDAIGPSDLHSAIAHDVMLCVSSMTCYVE